MSGRIMNYNVSPMLVKAGAILGIFGSLFFYYGLLSAFENGPAYGAWAIGLQLVIFGPLTVVALLLTLYGKRFFYISSLVLAVPFLITALWLVFMSLVTGVTSAFGVTNAIFGVMFGIVLTIPPLLVFANTILGVSKKKIFIKTATWGAVGAVFYTLFFALFIALNVH